MIKIIETNISLDIDNLMKDHQSRVIEADSWDEYIRYYKQNIETNRNESTFKLLTGLVGSSLPKYGEISELKYDDFHLSCYVTDGFHETLKLAYKI